MTDKSTLSCRGCLADLSTDNVHCFVWPEIKELFVECTKIQIQPGDNNLPQQICSECLSKCEQWDTFRKMCNDVNDHLLKKYSNGPDVNMDTCSNNDQEDDLDQYTFGELVVDSENDEPLTLVEKLLLSDGIHVTEDSNPSYLADIKSDKQGSSDKIHEKESLTQMDERNKSEESDEKSSTAKVPGEKRITDQVECPVCQKVMLRRNLATHCVVHTDERPYQCVYCKAEFSLKQTAKYHVAKKHPGRPLTNNGVLVKKGSIFEGPRPWEAMGYFLDKERRPKSSVFYKCSICNKSCGSSYLLRTHSLVHTGQRSYTCVYCKKSFLQERLVHLHIRRCHTGKSISGGVTYKSAERRELSSQDTLSCPQCNQTFGTKRYLKKHIDNHRRKNLDTEEDSTDGEWQ